MRAYNCDGNVYIIRDVWKLDGKLLTCQYAVKSAVHGDVWVDIYEGARMEDMKPYCTLEEWRTPLPDGRVAEIMKLLGERFALDG